MRSTEDTKSQWLHAQTASPHTRCMAPVDEELRSLSHDELVRESFVSGMAYADPVPAPAHELGAARTGDEHDG